jgi:uncharacterized phage protein (TIGR01671 family)
MKPHNLKFRAYDKKEKKWLMGYDMPNLGGFSLFGELVLLGEWSGVLDTYLFDRLGHKAEDLVVMQYSGLTDKDGKEIYGGDIIEDFAEGLREVEFVDGGFWLSEPYMKHYMPDKENRKIVGNVWDNPELLK